MSLYIQSSGMVTGLGDSAAASCAAIRGGISAFAETSFWFDNDWLVGSAVPMEDLSGRAKLLRMTAMAIDDCLAPVGPMRSPAVSVVLCLAETERPGRMEGLDASFLSDLRSACSLLDRAGVTDASSAVLTNGRVSGIEALRHAERVIRNRHAASCLIVGVDSYLSTEMLRPLHAARRLKTAEWSNGFIPGEAACALLVAAEPRAATDLVCMGTGTAREPAPLGSGHPLQAKGMTQAIRAALEQAGVGFEVVDYRLADVSGEQYRFKEAALAAARVMRVRKEALDLWLPAESVGEVGAASGPLALGIAWMAARKGYAPGPGVLCHFSNDAGARAAAVLRAGRLQR